MKKYIKDAEKQRRRSAKKENKKFRQRLQRAAECCWKKVLTSRPIMMIKEDLQHEVCNITDRVKQRNEVILEERIGALLSSLLLFVLVSIFAFFSNLKLQNWFVMIGIFSVTALVILIKVYLSEVSYHKWWLRYDQGYLEQLKERLRWIVAREEA